MLEVQFISCIIYIKNEDNMSCKYNKCNKISNELLIHQ